MFNALGSGLPLALITFGIQVISPLLLLYSVFYFAGDDINPRFDVEVDGEGDLVRDAVFPATDFDQWCFESNPQPEGKILISVVLWVYITTTIPTNYLRFYRTSGGAHTTFSKINSLRQIIWNKNDDSAYQQLGFKLDRLMKTGYVSLLYATMLFILVQTPNIIDVILNALAIEFIHEIDERIANSGWYDENNRYITAGTMELVIQATLNLQDFDDVYETCDLFDIDVKDYHSNIGPHPLKDVHQARRDDADTRFMTKKERIFNTVAEEARDLKNGFAIGTYKKAIVQFGIIDSLYGKLGLRSKGIFHRYLEYRTWSRWEQLVFLSYVPEENDKPDDSELVEVDLGTSDWIDFSKHVVIVLTGVELISSIVQACGNGRIVQVPLKFVLGLLEFLFYWIQVWFPLFILGCIGLVPLCY